MSERAARALLDEQIADYRARAPGYDEWFLRLGRYDRGEAQRRAWFAESADIEVALEAGSRTVRPIASRRSGRRCAPRSPRAVPARPRAAARGARLARRRAQHRVVSLLAGRVSAGRGRALQLGAGIEIARERRRPKLPGRTHGAPMLQLAIPPIGPVHGARADASDDSSDGAESRIVPKLLPREEVRQPKWATELLREYRTRAN